MSNQTNHQAGFSSASGPDKTTPGSVTLSDRVRSLRIPDRAPAQPIGRWWLPWVLCAIFVSTTAFFAFRSPSAPAPLEEKGPESDMLKKATKVTGSNVFLGAGPDRQLAADAVLLESKGYILPVQLIQVSPKVSGMVEKLYIKEGQLVRKGDTLAQLESIEYAAEYERAAGALAAAQQKLQELEKGNRPEEITQAKQDLEEGLVRKEQLYKEYKRNLSLNPSSSLSQKEYEEAYAEYKAMEHQVEKLKAVYQLMQKGPRIEKIQTARAELQQAEAEMTKAKWRLDSCTVVAPIDGLVLSKKSEEGNIVNPVAFNISASLCEMADLYNLEVELDVAERDISKVFKGQICKVRPEAFMNRVYWGTVSRLMPMANRAKGAIPVRVKIDIAPVLEQIQPSGIATALGLSVLPKAPGALTCLGAYAVGSLEKQGEYLRPEMGALVTFLNARTE